VITIDKPMKFLAAIQGFGEGLPNSIDLPNTAVTSENFSDNHLKLFDQGKLVADLNIVGDFTTNQFVLRQDGTGGTQITFSASGTLFPGTSAAVAAPADDSVTMPVSHS
jgi:hypothetical protein